MKSKIVVLLLVFYSLSLFSQDEKKVRIGVKGGVNLSNILYKTDSRSVNGDFKFGYEMGIYCIIYLGNSFYLNPELLFSLQGKKVEIHATDENGEQLSFDKIYFNEKNIIMPMLIRYFPNEKLNFLLGPQLAYFVSGKAEYTGVDIYNNNTYNYNPSLGVVGGIGFDFNKNFGLELRYNFGFNRNKIKNYRTNDSVWMLNLNYTFN